MPVKTLLLDVVKKHLVLAHAEETTLVPLKSARRLAIVAYLVDARRKDSAGLQLGYRSAGKIAAEAPGLGRLTNPANVGKEIWRIADSSDVLQAIIEAPEGLTVGPWRISLPPAQIDVADEDALAALLRSQVELSRHHPRDVHGADDQAGRRVPGSADLALIAQLVATGSLGTGEVREQIRAALKTASTSRDESVRAEAMRLDALLLRQEGKLVQADRQAHEALATHRASPAPEPSKVAEILDELGAIAYRRADYAASRSYFEDERRVLNEAGLAQSAEASRALRCLALTAIRLFKIDEAIVLARDAQEISKKAKDDVGFWMARAVELRGVARRGGIEDGPHAMGQLLRAATLAPATDASALLFIRRVYLESLYTMQDHLVDALEPDARTCMEGRISARDVARALLRDALTIGSARDADAVVRLLREYGQGDVLADFPHAVRLAVRDEIDDIEVLRGATPVLGRHLRLAALER